MTTMWHQANRRPIGTTRLHGVLLSMSWSVRYSLRLRCLKASRLLTASWRIMSSSWSISLARTPKVDEQGRFRIARRVAKDRVISTVDRQARHGHKSKARKFDGFKAHIRSDPDGEINERSHCHPCQHPRRCASRRSPRHPSPTPTLLTPAPALMAMLGWVVRPVVYGDAGYGSAETLEMLIEAGFEFVIKVPSPTRRGGLWSKTDFGVDTDNSTVCCPAGVTVGVTFAKDGSGVARFAQACDRCPLRSRCTTAPGGRTISIHRREEHPSNATSHAGQQSRMGGRLQGDTTQG